jgi:hypothetical protein
MSTTLQSAVPGSPAALKNLKNKKKEFGHRVRVTMAALASFLLLTGIGLYGLNYYTLPLEQRPYSVKHELLRPSGSIGLKLGYFGTLLFFIIFLYAFRKIIPWLGRFGTARHWMDFHVICGVTAPVVIAFHASFKFGGLAGIAFWIMLCVALSGIIGRYLYAQIPRSLNAADLSWKESHAEVQELSDALVGQSIYSAEQLNRVFAVPSAEHIRKIGTLSAIGEMIALDLRRPFQVASLRRAAAGPNRNIRSIGGLFSCGDPEVERVVQLARQKAALSKRVIFLDQTQKVFHLWHVIHRPFSYAFALLAIIHICVVSGLGFMSLGWR